MVNSRILISKHRKHSGNKFIYGSIFVPILRKWPLYFLFFLQSCQLHNSEKLEISFNIKDSNQTMINTTCDTIQTGFIVETIIKNNTDTITKFWIMSSYWYDNFGYSKYYQFLGNEDRQNIPELIVLKPGDAKVFTSKLWVVDSIRSLKKNVDIGFVLVNEKELPGQSLSLNELILIKQRQNRDIIWGRIAF